MELHDRVLGVFRSAMDIEGDIDTDLLAYREFGKWTSLAHMMLIAALEDEFDVMLETEDILAMSTFDKAVEIMARYDSRH
jgi:acyl carrier protein